MPTSWKRSPEELHKVYVENTEAFYRAAGRACARELDSFMQGCAIALWARAGSVTQAKSPVIMSATLRTAITMDAVVFFI